MRSDDRREIQWMAGVGCLVLVFNLLWIVAVVAAIALVIRAVFL